jgi:hypothetical protein
MRDSMLDGEIKRSAVSDGLATRNDFLDHNDGLCCALVSVETEIWGRIRTMATPIRLLLHG